MSDQYTIMNATLSGLDAQPGVIGKPYSIVLSAAFMHDGYYSHVGMSFSARDLEFKRLTSLKKDDLYYKEALFKTAWKSITSGVPVQLTETPDHISMAVFDPDFRNSSDPNASLIYLSKSPNEQIESYSYMIDPDDYNVFILGQTKSPSFGFEGVESNIRGTHYFLSDRVKMLGIDRDFMNTILLSNDLETLRDSYADLTDEIIGLNRINDEEKIVLESLNEDFKTFNYNTNLVIF